MVLDRMRLLSSDEVLQVLGIKKPTLYAWVRRGKLQPYKVGRLLKFDEDEVRAMIRRGATYAWVFDGPLATAVELARGRVGNGPADYRLEYLEPPKAMSARVRIQVRHPRSDDWIDIFSPNGTYFAPLERLKSGGGYLFLGTLDPWRIADLRVEEGPEGERFLAAFVERALGPEPGPSSEALRRLEEGIFPGPVPKWTRDELHDRSRLR